MSIMDFFKPQTQPQAEAQPASPQQPQAPAAAAAPNPNSPAQSMENPLDTYTKVFENAAKASDIQAPSFALDPKIISEVSGKMDLTQGINPELMQKATSGDAAAMVELIQAVGRSAYSAALQHSTKLTDVHLGQRSDFERKQSERVVKDQLTSNALVQSADDTTNYNHPVIKAELNRIAKALAASPEYADASPQQIATATKEYFKQLQGAMNPAAPTKQSEQAGEIDYMKYILGPNG